MNMVEKVAKAIDEAAAKNTGEARIFDSNNESEKEFIKLIARAAIEAMKEPNEEMYRATKDLLSSCVSTGITYERVSAIHKAMIEAALKE